MNLDKKRAIVPGWKVFLTWLVRIAVGSTFIFSGYVKGLDPWGTVYKVNDYLGAMNLPVWPTAVSAGVIVLCVFEFLIGVFILLGCFRRSAPILGLLFMAVMLPLTGWIWATHPVSDCGCFGDAFIISDAATFWKNVALTAGFVWLVAYNKRVRCLITPYLQWIATVASGLFLFVVAEIGYLFQPLADFRPYPVGARLVPESNSSFTTTDEDAEYEFIYRKDGVEKSFGETDELPSEEDGWVFVETRRKGAGEEEPETEGLRIWNGDEDVSEEYLSAEGPLLLLMMPRLGEVSISETWQINSIYEWCQNHGVEMIAVINGTPQEIADWRDRSLSEYPIFTAEDTQIKEVVRGQAALVYTLDGDIVWKNTLRAAWRPGFDPDNDNIDTEEMIEDLSQLKEDNSSLLRNLWMIYIAVIFVLIALSFSSRLLLGFKPRTIHGDKVHCEESSLPEKSAP